MAEYHPVILSRITPLLVALSISVLAFSIFLGNIQSTYALTPVADLTGTWSGFAILQNTEGTCEFRGKVNANFRQDGNHLSGEYSYVGTGAKASSPEYYCYDFNYSENISGTLDGSRLSLRSDSGTFSGSYASSGISLNIQSDELIGSVKLSPTNFTPPPFESKNKPPIESNVNEMVQTGVSYLNEKRFDKALEHFNKVISKDKNNIMGWMGGGVSYVGLKNYDQAITQFKKSLEIVPNNKDALQWLGRAYYLKNDCKTSSEYYSAALKSDPKNAKMLEEKKIIDSCIAKQKSEKKSESKPDNTKSDDAKPIDMKKTTKKSEIIEPPTPSVFKVNDETKPFFKALWDGKCDILSRQWELITAKSGRLPVVCTGGTITLDSGEVIQFSAGDDWDVKLLKWGGEGLAAKYVETTIPPLGALMKIFETATSPIETIKTLNLAISKGQTELLGGVIKINVHCATGNCKLLKTEEEGGGFKIYDIVSSYDPQTQTIQATINHNSVYILVEYATQKPQDKTKYQSYENKQYGFSIKHPSNWEKKETLQKDPNSGFVSIVSFAPSQNTVYGIGFSADNSDYRGLNEKQFLAKMKKQINDACATGAKNGISCSDITVLSDTHKNGYKMYGSYYTASVPTDQGTVTIMEASAYIPDGNDIWSLQVFSSAPTELEEFGKDVFASLDTFTISNYDKPSKTAQKQAPKKTVPIVQSSSGTMQLNSAEFTVSKYTKTDAVVSGQINSYQQGVPVTLYITKPDGTVEQQNAMVTKDGMFKIPLKIGNNWGTGTYTINAKYGSQDLGSVSFQVKIQ